MTASRRAFLGSSLASLAAAPILAAEADVKAIAKPAANLLLPSMRLFDDAVFQPNTMLLTWRRDPTTTMVVQWIGVRGETDDTNIYYTPASAALVPGWKKQATASKPYPFSDFRVFRAELTELKPGTDYVFQVGKQSPTYRFRTMPAKATDTISFISGGDCGVNSHAIANNIQAAKQDPMFTVIGGDLAYENGRSVDTHLAFVRNYAKHMLDSKGRIIPLVATLGNHEVDGGYSKSREKAPFFFALFDALFSETSYATLDFGDYLSLVLLDTGHISKVAGAQTEWLEKTLKERADHPHVIPVNHVPCYPSNRNMEEPDGKPGTGADQRKYWTPLFDKYRTPLVLEHHDHTFKRTAPLIDGMRNDHGVLYLGDGSWGRIRAPKKPEKMPILAKSSEAYHMSLHRIEGEERFHLALDERGRVMDVCRSGQRASKT